MNVEIEAEAALFPEKEYINGIAVAVQAKVFRKLTDPLPTLCLLRVPCIVRITHWIAVLNFSRIFGELWLRIFMDFQHSKVC